MAGSVRVSTPRPVPRGNAGHNNSEGKSHGEYLERLEKKLEEIEKLRSEAVDKAVESQDKEGVLRSIGIDKYDQLDEAVKAYQETYNKINDADVMNAAEILHLGIPDITNDQVISAALNAALTAKATRSSAASVGELMATANDIYKDRHYKDVDNVDFSEIFSGMTERMKQKFNVSPAKLNAMLKSSGHSLALAGVRPEDTMALYGMLSSTMSGEDAGKAMNAFYKDLVDAEKFINSQAQTGENKTPVSFFDKETGKARSAAEIIAQLKARYGEDLSAQARAEIAKGFKSEKSNELIDNIWSKSGKLESASKDLAAAGNNRMKEIERKVAIADNNDAADLGILRQKKDIIKGDLGALLLKAAIEDEIESVDTWQKFTNFYEEHPELAKYLVYGGAALEAAIPNFLDAISNAPSGRSGRRGGNNPRGGGRPSNDNTPRGGGHPSNDNTPRGGSGPRIGNGPSNGFRPSNENSPGGPRPPEGLGGGSRALKLAGKVAKPLSSAMSASDAVLAALNGDPITAAGHMGESIGGNVGALAGDVVGGAIGTAIAPGVGTGVGAFALGAVGGEYGADLGREAFTWLAKLIFESSPKTLPPPSKAFSPDQRPFLLRPPPGLRSPSLLGPDLYGPNLLGPTSPRSDATPSLDATGLGGEPDAGRASNSGGAPGFGRSPGFGGAPGFGRSPGFGGAPRGFTTNLSAGMGGGMGGGGRGVTVSAPITLTVNTAYGQEAAALRDMIMTEVQMMLFDVMSRTQGADDELQDNR